MTSAECGPRARSASIMMKTLRRSSSALETTMSPTRSVVRAIVTMSPISTRALTSATGRPKSTKNSSILGGLPSSSAVSRWMGLAAGISVPSSVSPP